MRGAGGLDDRATLTGARAPHLQRLLHAAGTDRVRRVVYALLAIDVVLVASHVVSALVLGFSLRLTDLDAELNIPTWYSATKLTLVALAFAGIALLRDSGERWTRAILLAPAFLFAFLSLDEAAGIHETLGRRIDLVVGVAREDTVLHRTSFWMFVLGPPLILAMAVIGMFYRRLLQPPAEIVGLAVVGVCVFLAGALAVEIAWNFVDAHHWQVAQVALEEGMEMIGVTMILAAALFLLASNLREAAHAAGVSPQARPNRAARK